MRVVAPVNAEVPLPGLILGGCKKLLGAGGRITACFGRGGEAFMAVAVGGLADTLVLLVGACFFKVDAVVVMVVLLPPILDACNWSSKN
jgi:hypothetical protein